MSMPGFEPWTADTWIDRLIRYNLNTFYSKTYFQKLNHNELKNSIVIRKLIATTILMLWYIQTIVWQMGIGVNQISIHLIYFYTFIVFSYLWVFTLPWAVGKATITLANDSKWPTSFQSLVLIFLLC